MKKCLFLTQNPFKSDPEKCLYHIYILYLFSPWLVVGNMANICVQLEPRKIALVQYHL